MDRPTNRLADESSSYLRQHMHNPVDWYPWGDEALSRARALDRPLLVSIGYSACHWCHVMERESFENEATAALMNAGFVNVKVDREERPDVDQIYMDTVVRLTGHGGWPLTVFCTPDGRPFYAGTYFPPEPRHGLLAFPDLLNRISALYRGERAKIEESAGQILSALRARPRGVASGLPGPQALLAAARELMQAADEQNGGFGRPGPKFPTPTNLQLVLAALPDMEGDEAERTRSFLSFSCAQMARRGLYDPLGGGFHRYCVDEHWGVPHFEKMLYDQAQLIGVYADLFRQDGCQDENLAWPIRETAAYLRREMRGPEGGYYASQDADSEGVEGRFYVWTPAEVEAVLGGARAEAFCARYGVTERGNFEGSTVLWDLERGPRGHLAAEREALYQARCERVWPATDEKRLASWNGLAISGLAHAGSVLDDAELLADARAALDFIETHLIDGDGRLLRVFNAGVARVPGFLDDHAAVLAAALDLYRAAGAPADLALALRLAETIAERFFDADEGDLFLTPNDGERLPHRPRSDHDGALPNSTGLAVIGLLRVAALTGKHDLRRVAEAVIRGHAFELERAPLGFPTLLRAAAWHARELGTAVIAGPDTPATHALAREARLVLAPEESVVVAAPGASPGLLDESLLRGRDPKDGQATAYLCRGTRCSLPVTTARGLASLL